MHSLKLGLRTDIDSRDMHLEGITTRAHRAAGYHQSLSRPALMYGLLRSTKPNIHTRSLFFLQFLPPSHCLSLLFPAFPSNAIRWGTDVVRSTAVSPEQVTFHNSRAASPGPAKTHERFLSCNPGKGQSTRNWLAK